MALLDKIAKGILGRRNEYFTLPLAILIMLASTFFGNMLGIYVYGVEVFQKLIIALVFVLIINVFTRWVMQPIFPTLFRYLDEDNKEVNGWLPLKVKERIFLAFGLFALFFWGLVHIVSSL